MGLIEGAAVDVLKFRPRHHEQDRRATSARRTA